MAKKGLTAKRFYEIQVGSYDRHRRDWDRFFEIMFPKKGGKK